MEHLTTILIAVIGGIVGSFVPILIERLRTRANRNRELLVLAIQTAIEDFKADHNKAESLKDVRPMSYYTYYHFEYFQLLDKGRPSPKDIKDLIERAIEISSTLRPSSQKEE